jgi:hypothetical protein
MAHRQLQLRGVAMRLSKVCLGPCPPPQGFFVLSLCARRPHDTSRTRAGPAFAIEQPTPIRRRCLHRFSTFPTQQQSRLVNTFLGPGPSRNPILLSDQQNIGNCHSSSGYAHLAQGRPTVACPPFAAGTTDTQSSPQHLHLNPRHTQVLSTTPSATS